MARSPRYEGSPEDRRKDRAAAKKAGVTMKAWEKSAADKVKDRAGQKKIDAKKKRKK